MYPRRISEVPVSRSWAVSVQLEGDRKGKKARRGQVGTLDSTRLPSFSHKDTRPLKDDA